MTSQAHSGVPKTIYLKMFCFTVNTELARFNEESETFIDWVISKGLKMHKQRLLTDIHAAVSMNMVSSYQNSP